MHLQRKAGTLADDLDQAIAASVNRFELGSPPTASSAPTKTSALR